MFIEWIKNVSNTMDKAYGEAKKFVILEKELKLVIKNKEFMEPILKEEKRRIRPYKMIRDKVITNKNNHFAPKHRERVNDQEILDLGVDLCHLLKVHF